TVEKVTGDFLANLRILIACSQTVDLKTIAQTPDARAVLPAPGLRFVNDSLFALLQEGIESPVDAAALSYWPDAFIKRIGVGKEEVIDSWAANQPAVLGI